MTDAEATADASMLRGFAASSSDGLFGAVRERCRANGAKAAYTLAGGTIGIGVLAALAHLSDNPFIFPSVGATAVLTFSAPASAAASPRNTLVSHSVGAIIGLMMLILFGLYGDASAIVEGVSWIRVAAAGIAVGLTGGALVLIDKQHPPAGATTLIVSLGLMGTFTDVGILLAAIALFVVLAGAINGRYAAQFHGSRSPRW